jgi:hypothetical protein
MGGGVFSGAILYLVETQPDSSTLQAANIATIDRRPDKGEGSANRFRGFISILHSVCG